MARIVGTCPVCQDEMRVVRLRCRACGTALEGDFPLGRILRLSPEQMDFVEVFLRNRGKIKDVEEELGISYPTVVARLNDVISAMGFEAAPGDVAASEERRAARRQVLDDLEAGRISATEAASRLRELRDQA